MQCKPRELAESRRELCASSVEALKDEIRNIVETCCLRVTCTLPKFRMQSLFVPFLDFPSLAGPMSSINGEESKTLNDDLHMFNLMIRTMLRYHGKDSRIPNVTLLPSLYPMGEHPVEYLGLSKFPTCINPE